MALIRCSPCGCSRAAASCQGFEGWCLRRPLTRGSAYLCCVAVISVALREFWSPDWRRPPWSARVQRLPTSGSGRAFERLATFPVYRNSPDPTTETVAEITAASTDGRTLISTDSPGERVTFTDISNPGRPQPAGALAVGGEPTSVAVYRSYALIAVNTSSDFTDPSGDLLVVSLKDRSEVARIDAGRPARLSGHQPGRRARRVVRGDRDRERTRRGGQRRRDSPATGRFRGLRAA